MDITTDLPECRFGARQRLDEKWPEPWFPALWIAKWLRGSDLN